MLGLEWALLGVTLLLELLGPQTAPPRPVGEPVVVSQSQASLQGLDSIEDF
mgnify:CR=1 FL=1